MNRNTWLVKVWIENDRDLYEDFKRHYSSLLNGSDIAIRAWFNSTSNCTDNINWGRVDFDMIRQFLKEMAEELELN